MASWGQKVGGLKQCPEKRWWSCSNGFAVVPGKQEHRGAKQHAMMQLHMAPTMGTGQAALPSTSPSPVQHPTSWANRYWWWQEWHLCSDPITYEHCAFFCLHSFYSIYLLLLNLKKKKIINLEQYGCFLCLKCLSEAVPVQPDIDSSSSALRETSEAMCWFRWGLMEAAFNLPLLFSFPSMNICLVQSSRK